MFKNERSKQLAIIGGISLVILYGILSLLIQAGVSFDRFKELIAKFASILSPIFIGCVIAYLLNPIMKIFETKVLKNMTRPKLRRGLAVLLTYLLVILLIAGIFALILPQIVGTVEEFGANIGNYSSALTQALAGKVDDLNRYVDAHPSIKDFLISMNVYDWLGKVIEEDQNVSDNTTESTPETTPETTPEADTQDVSDETDTVTDVTTDTVTDEVTDAEETGDEASESETLEEETTEQLPAETENETTLQEESTAAPESGTTSTPQHEFSFEAISSFLASKITDLTQYLTTAVASLLDYLLDFALSFFSFLKNLLLGFFISIYILLSKERLGAQCKKILSALFKENHLNELLRIFKYSDRTVGRFMIGTLIDAILVGILTFIFLTIFDIKYAALIALIIGVTNMIPFFGPFIGAIPSAMLIFIDDITRIINETPTGEPYRFKCITFIILVLVIQQIDGNIINPRISGNSTGLSSLGVVVSITIMSDLFGFFGMLLGVPVAAIIVGLVKELLEKKLEKKQLPIALADYYSKHALIPPESEEEEEAAHKNTAFYRWMMATLEKIRHGFRKFLYHSGTLPLKTWVSLKLFFRKIHHGFVHKKQHLAQKLNKKKDKTDRQ